jgi:hypothetical protein
VDATPASGIARNNSTGPKISGLIKHIVVAQCGAAVLTAPLNIGVGIK